MDQAEPAPRLRAVYSTIAAGDIAHEVAAAYDLGPVASCVLIRRGFNDVYGVRFESGVRAVARLASLRARGLANSPYEAALLLHLKAAGVAVAAPVRRRDGAMWQALSAAEGLRDLMLFEHLDGEPPRNNSDIALMGAGLARIHEAGEHYVGPASLYAHSFDHLRRGGLQQLMTAPTMTAALRAGFTDFADRLEARVAEPRLTQVACHGDCHGGNSFMIQQAGGERAAGFFDFDDAGPGPLAYDLAVYLWALLYRPAGAATAVDQDALERWTHLLAGYRGVRELPDPDYQAIARFVPVRHLWFMGEYASRIPEWGTEIVTTAWLERQLKTLESWETLETPQV